MKRMLRRFWARLYLRWSGVCLKHYEEKQPYTLDGKTIHNLCPTCEAEQQLRSMVARQRAVAVLQPQVPETHQNVSQQQSPKSWN